jgi:hypothetical protein
MTKRLNLPPPDGRDPGSIALDYGSLAGVTPVDDAADYLEKLARQLQP